MKSGAVFLALLLQAGTPPTSAELVTLGESLAARGDGRKAQAHLEKALADDALPAAERARGEAALGLALLQQKKPADAAAHLERSTTLLPTVDKTWLLLGVAKDQQGDTGGALDAYRRGTQACPKSTALAHEYGMALLAAGRNDDGAAVLTGAAARAEQDGELMSDAAYALTLVGRFREAKDHASHAVELNPDGPDALYVLGVAEAGLGNLKAARTAFEEAIDADETHVPALFQLGVLLQRQKDDAGAVRRFQRVLQVEPEHARARAALGLSLARLGTDDQRAVTLLQETLRVDPRAALAHALLAEIHARQGQRADAIKSLQAALKLKPDEEAWKRRLEELKAAK
jgi:tetratricopeptide (TPR) repeat protein